MLYTRTVREYRRPTYNHTLGHNLEGRYSNFEGRYNNFEGRTNRGFEFGFEGNTNWDWNCQYAMPACDILELDEQYILEIALPGVVLDDVELKVEENFLTVVAKRTPAMFEEKASILRKELPAGYLVREFEFETEIRHEEIEARMDRGILFVSIPKVEQALRIPVSAGNIEGHLPGMKTTRVQKNDNLRGHKEVTIK